MKDYSKRCWFCDRNLMEPMEGRKKDWFQCSGCGATWSKQGDLGSPAAHLANDPGGAVKQSYSPTPYKRKGVKA
jgi:hypothetical protein